MPQYRLTKDHYLQVKKPGAKPGDKDPWVKEPQLHEQGSVVDWDGKPSLQMEAVDKEGGERIEARRAEWREKKASARDRAAKSSVGWSQSYERNMERIITRSTDENAPPVAIAGSGRAAADKRGRGGRKAA